MRHDVADVRTGSMLLLPLLLLALPTDASAAEPSFDVGWDSTPSEVAESVDEPLEGSDWRNFGSRYRDVQLHGSTWQRYFIFYEDRLIAQGYRRTETPENPRHGTISDIVSYGNDYWMASALESSFGPPDFKDVRTKSDYSRELGDPALRARRSIHWDFRGERLRWETDDGTVRYSVRYSLKGERDHDVVRVKPGAEKHFHFFRIARAFRRAGIRVVRQFEAKSRKMVVAMVTSSGEVVKSTYETEGEKLVPVQPDREQHTVQDCDFRGHDCTVTFRTYGGRVYRVDVDLSAHGEIGRRERGGYEKVGRRTYERFLALNDELSDALGSPAADNSVEELSDDRKLRKVERIPHGMQAFWTVWYDASDDVLARHRISGNSSGASWHVDHRLTFRLHSVSRAFAEERAWKKEAAAIEEGAGSVESEQSQNSPDEDSSESED